MGCFSNLKLADYILDESISRRLTSPALIIDLAKVRHNIEHMLEAVGGAQHWRPHVKTTKSPLIWNELIQRGVCQFKCATAREARALATALRAGEHPGGDVLLAHPAIGPALMQMGNLARDFPEIAFSVISEDPSHVADIPENLGVFVDIDPGYERTGIAVGDHEAVLSVARAAGNRLRGVHYYEGQHTNLNMDERRRAAFAGYEELMELMEVLDQSRLPVGELITSGTPAFLCALEFEGFEGMHHRVSPGTVVLHDWRSETQLPGFGLIPAAVVFTRVVSHPGSSRFTCDAGSKSIAAEAGHPCASVIGSPGYDAQIPSEEHLPILVGDGQVPDRGEQLYLVPKHICPTVNLAEEAIIVDGRELIGSFPIVARAHDTLLRE